MPIWPIGRFVVSPTALEGYNCAHVDNNERLISELSRVLSRRGLSVRSEQLWGVHPGGKCRLKGKQVLLLNTKAPSVERLIVLADCYVEEGIADVELSVEAHALLQRRIARRSDVLAPADAARPGLAKGAGAPKKQRRI
jgi:hypothetical protein